MSKRRSNSLLARIGGAFKSVVSSSSDRSFERADSFGPEDQLVGQEDGERNRWEAIDAFTQDRVVILLSYEFVTVINEDKDRKDYEVPLHLVKALNYDSDELIFSWVVETSDDTRTYKMQNPKAFSDRFFEIVDVRVKDAKRLSSVQE
eukprot:TRINITY_DN14815_c0_g1_i1.p1 TRINITY_DN14815_c0_g1~~TRINITY_DN14815_c0_g1_i1.p1  ORF type:complete len:148 (+),score=36.48 TRINITY_DN14815_c0_g1_i1:47-490(+)